MVHIAGCGRRSPFSSKGTISVALTLSYGRWPYVNNSQIVTPLTKYFKLKYTALLQRDWNCSTLCYNGNKCGWRWKYCIFYLDLNWLDRHLPRVYITLTCGTWMPPLKGMYWSVSTLPSKNCSFASEQTIWYMHLLLITDFSVGESPVLSGKTPTSNLLSLSLYLSLSRCRMRTERSCVTAARLECYLPHDLSSSDDT